MIIDKLDSEISMDANIDEHLYLSRIIMRKYGIDTATILWELIAYRDKLEQQNQLDEDEFFHISNQYMKSTYKLSDYKQRKALNQLHEFGLIEIRYKAYQRLRYVKLNADKIVEVFKCCGQDERR